MFNINFREDEYRSNSLLTSDKMITNWHPRSQQRIRHACCCQFVPTHIQKSIQGASPEVRAEHKEIVAEYKAKLLEIPATAANPVKLEHPALFGVHLKKLHPTNSEVAESLQLIYNAKRTTNIPGKLVKKPKGNVDKTINRAFEGGKATYMFQKEILGRNSTDNQGMKMTATVHYGVDYNNAEWLPKEDGVGNQMLYGDGDGEIFDDFTKDPDVIFHEETHGVTQFTANLEYQGQSGALNESISDVFASCNKHWLFKQTVEEADWKIGDVVLIGPGALRSLKEPGTAYDTPLMGKDPQPKSMDAYNYTTEDNGGVHINSGIPNHAFYLVCKSMGGYSYEKPIKIWYQTLISKELKPDADFSDFASLSIKQAGSLFGKNSLEQKNVINAWNDVKVKVQIS